MEYSRGNSEWNGPVSIELLQDINVYLLDFDPTSNQCIPIHQWYEPSALNDLSVQIGLGIVYGLIWLLGVVGNCLVLAVVLYSAVSSSKMKRRNNTFAIRSVFVASLSCADLLVALTSLPITAVTGFTAQWVFPDFLCPCMSFFQAFSIFQSSFTFTNLAIDRYLLIVYPDRTFVTYGRAKFAVMGTAALAALIASPMAIFMDVVQLAPLCGRSCVEIWPQTAYEESTEILANFDDDDSIESNVAALSRRIYGLLVTLLQLALPAIVTSVCYVLISQQLTRHQRIRTRSSLLNPEVVQRLADRRRRTNRMMASMVTAFVIAWLPLNTVNLLRDFGIFRRLFEHRSFKVAHVLCHMIAMSSLFWNPLLYAWYNESMRNTLVTYFDRWRSVKRGRLTMRRRKCPCDMRMVSI